MKNRLINNRFPISIINQILFGLFFFLPAASNYPGRIYYYLANLQNYYDLAFGDVSFFNLLLLPTIIISVLMLIYRLINDPKTYYGINGFSLCLLAIVLCFFIAGTLSTLANYDTPMVIIQYVSSIFSTMLLTLAFINLKLSSQSIRIIFVAFACGCSFPLISGLYAYYHAWGIPQLDEIILSHFNFVKMQQYSIQTFGNVDNTAIVFGMAGVIFFGCSINKNTSNLQKTFFGLCLALTILHLFILEVRTSLILFFGITLILSFIQNKKIFWLYLSIMISTFFLIYLISPQFILLFFKRLSLALTWSSEGSSQSAAERLQAMHLGWDIFIDHFYLGVGPGGSKYFNIYSTAHQFNIQQGLELGFLGFISSILWCSLAILRFIALAIRYYIQHQNFEKIILCSSSAFYFIYAIVANTPLAMGVVNTWISLAILMQLLSD